MNKIIEHLSFEIAFQESLAIRFDVKTFLLKFDFLCDLCRLCVLRLEKTIESSNLHQKTTPFSITSYMGGTRTRIRESQPLDSANNHSC